MKLVLTILVFSLFSNIALSQPRGDLARNKYISFGIQANAINYFGDLSPTPETFSTDLNLTKPNFGIQASYKFTKNLSWRASLIYGQLKGDDFESADINDVSSGIYRYARNLHFRNNIIEFANVVTFDVIPNKGRFFYRKFATPYIFAGIALLYSNPQAKVPDTFIGSEAGTWVKLRSLNTEGQGKDGYNKSYSTIQLSIPFGGGVRFRLTERLDLSLELGVRYALTDYLDDVSAKYANPDDLDGDLARIMANPSAFANSTVSGEARDLATLTTFFGPLTTNNTTDGGSYPTIAGYGQGGDVRGKNSQNDVYVVTGFHLNYILTIKRYRPRSLGF